MDVIEALAIFVWSISSYAIPSKCEATGVMKYSAANTSVMHDTKNGLHFAKFFQLRNLRLKVAPIKVLQVETEKDCLVNCVANLKCVSLNLVMLQTKGYMCELLATDMFNIQVAKNLTQGPHYRHITLEVMSTKMT